MNQATIGRPEDNPLKGRDEIMHDISNMANILSVDPCGDLCFLIDGCYKLWEMHQIAERTRVEGIVLKVKS